MSKIISKFLFWLKKEKLELSLDLVKSALKGEVSFRNCPFTENQLRMAKVSTGLALGTPTKKNIEKYCKSIFDLLKYQLKKEGI